MVRELFGYDQPILDVYPTIRAGVIEAGPVTNTASADGLLAEYREEQGRVARRLAGTSLADLPSIAAWRRAFSQFGVKPTQYRNAAEALLRRLTKHGDIPSFNALVDTGNLISIRYAMPVAVFDLSALPGGITVRFATGEERFTDLGSDEVTHPEKGEVVFVDGHDEVHARRWCWRQSANSPSAGSTTAALFVIEGHHDTAANDVDSAADDLIALLHRYQPSAGVTVHRLSPEQPVAMASNAPAP